MRKNEIAGGNMSFAVLHAARECDDFQFLREYTQNSIEAEAENIIWTPHHVYKNKLSCVDDGHGMSPTELVRYINTHYRSGKKQASNQNFGIGAKIAGLKNNTRIEFHSWQNGKGFGVTLIKNEKDMFVGLEERNAGVVYSVPLSMKPRWIKTHGTVVILHGNTEKENTVHPEFLKKAKGVSVSQRWIASYLNGHYYSVPEDRRILHIYPEKGELRTVAVEGQKFSLDERATVNGTLRITGAKVHWWLTDEDSRSDDNRKGFVGALHKNELFYEPQHFLNRGRLMQDFGVSVGYNQVFLIIEPEKAEMNQTRTSLAVGGKPFIPWMEWGAEFKENMPAAIVNHIEEHTTKESEQVAERMEDVFQRHAHRYQAKKYMKQLDGSPITKLKSSVTPLPGKGKPVSVGSGGGDGSGTGGGGTASTDAELMQRIFGERGQGRSRGKQIAHVELPKVQFITNKVKPNQCGYRAPGELEGRAARYSASSHELVINKDFKGFQNAIEEWSEKTPNVPAKKALIEKGVFDEVARKAIDLILTTLSYRWKTELQDEALSEVVLTAVLGQELSLYEALEHRFQKLRRERRI